MDKDFCNKCGECCNRIMVDFEAKTLYFDGIQILTPDFAGMLVPIEGDGNITYCRCKYLENNLCTNPNKPDICMNYPSSPFAYIPEDCGFSGDIFMKKEAEMRKIRKLKEEIINYEAMIKVSPNKGEQNRLQKIINSHKARIERFKNYGSLDW